NEAFYVETPREMAERGDYISPTFNYEPRFNKPVLSYWIVAAFYRLFGVSVGVERLAIALGAMILIATGFALAHAGADGPARARPHRGGVASGFSRTEAGVASGFSRTEAGVASGFSRT